MKYWLSCERDHLPTTLMAIHPTALMDTSLCAGLCTMATAGSPDEEPEGLDAGPQGVTVWLCDLGQPSDGDEFCSLTQQYVLSAYYVPSIYKKKNA